jgi:hypothetical protein
MSVIIGSARIDEHGNAHEGQAGDQKQTSTPDFKGEVSMQEFYVHSKGWIVARLKDAKQAKKCAKAMKTACNNPNIGYDQWQRYGLVKEDVDTKNKVETDCSALVRRCILDATGVDVGDIRTITMESVLSKSGLFQPLKQYTSGMTLCTGDVLFTGHLGHPVSGHTVVVVQGADRDDDSDDTSDGIKIAKPTLRKGDKSIEVKYLQKDLNKLGIKDDRQVKLVIDGDFGIHTESSLKRFQKIYKIEIDGIYGSESYETMKKAIKENV